MVGFIEFNVTRTKHYICSLREKKKGRRRRRKKKFSCTNLRKLEIHEKEIFEANSKEIIKSLAPYEIPPTFHFALQIT